MITETIATVLMIWAIGTLKRTDDLLDKWRDTKIIDNEWPPDVSDME